MLWMVFELKRLYRPSYFPLLFYLASWYMCCIHIDYASYNTSYSRLIHIKGDWTWYGVSRVHCLCIFFPTPSPLHWTWAPSTRDLPHPCVPHGSPPHNPTVPPSPLDDLVAYLPLLTMSLCFSQLPCFTTNVVPRANLTT